MPYRTPAPELAILQPHQCCQDSSDATETRITPADWLSGAAAALWGSHLAPHILAHPPHLPCLRQHAAAGAVDVIAWPAQLALLEAQQAGCEGKQRTLDVGVGCKHPPGRRSLEP